MTARLIVRTVEVPDPGQLLPRLPDTAGSAWLRRGEGLIAWGEALRLQPAGAARFDEAAAALDAVFGAADVDDPVGLPGSGPVAFASITFDPRSNGSVVIVPRTVVGRRDGRAWMTTIADADIPAGSDAPAPALGPVQALPAPGRVRYAGSSLPELRWLEAVDTAVKRIHTQDLTKVVLARDLLVWGRDRLDPRALALRLAERFADCHTFICDGLVGATPELLMRRSGDVVESLVLAGSARRGIDADDDAAAAAQLLASDKDRAEHLPAVDSVREALTGVAEELEVDPEPWLLRLHNVQHLATGVRGRIPAGPTALQLAGRLHPTAAVCGVPTDLARELIRSLEGMDRGRYSGPVGWVDGRGDGEFGIALRCAQLDGHRARLFAGAGIVAGSLPEAELEETRLKLLAMQSAFGRPSAHGKEIG